MRRKGRREIFHAMCGYPARRGNPCADKSSRLLGLSWQRKASVCPADGRWQADACYEGGGVYQVALLAVVTHFW